MYGALYNLPMCLSFPDIYTEYNIRPLRATLDFLLHFVNTLPYSMPYLIPFTLIALKTKWVAFLR